MTRECSRFALIRIPTRETRTLKTRRLLADKLGKGLAVRRRACGPHDAQKPAFAGCLSRRNARALSRQSQEVQQSLDAHSGLTRLKNVQAAAAAVSESKFLRRETGLQARTRRIVARYDACLTRRHGKRYRHGLRASELCDLQWSQVELATGRLHVRRAKNGSPSVHPMQGDEIRALRRLQREQGLSSHVFMTERDGPMTPKAFHALLGRIGARAKMPFPIHPHMLRHACGYALANAGHDTRALQAWLGHKNIQHTVRYTELAPDRFKNFWR